MSVYKHEYRAYSGKVTPARTRILVVARYGFAEVWSSKITIGLFILCLVPPLLALFGIYLANNPLARALIAKAGPGAVGIDADFFLGVLQVQSWFALVLASWIAPRLITFDLADNALPILLSHPISRVGYILGKYMVLFGMLSAVTWVPGQLLFAYQSYSSAQPWAIGHLQIAGGLFVGAALWIALVSILGLALSSLVKWRGVATGIIFAAVFVPAGIGAIVSGVLRTKWGFLLNLPFMMSLLWQRLLGIEGAFFSRMSLPNEAILTMLVLICSLCAAILNARIRAREVVRG
jgi:ABC-type transport system involved in multi-copper enzyme maturation permease subunit